MAISTTAREGFPRRVRLWEAQQAHALVVGREGTGRLADLLLGSTSLACATHSTGTPVIVVPRSWREGPAGGRGHSEVTGMLLGSVARAVLYLVDRPTAVVHEPSQED